MKPSAGSSSKDLFRQGLNVFAVAATLVVNILANALPLNGLSTGEISDRFEVYFVPAGYVFSIWGVIYLGLIAFAVYQALPSQRENPRLRRVGTLFAWSCLANILWLFSWHSLQFELTAVFMLALLGLLLAVYLRLGIGEAQTPRLERWLVDLPFSIYLGWISVATVANLSDLLWYWGWNGQPLQPEWWAVILLAVAAGLGLAMTITRRDLGYVLVLLWAFAGIAVKQASQPLVAGAAWAGVAALALMAGAAFLRQSKTA